MCPSLFRVVAFAVSLAVLTGSVSAQVFAAERPIATPTPMPFTTFRFEPAAATNGDKTLVVWSDAHTGNYDNHGAFVTVDLAAGAAVPIAPAWTEEDRASVAPHRDGFVVGWASSLGLHAAFVHPLTGVRGGLLPSVVFPSLNSSWSAIASTGSRVLLAAVAPLDSTAAELRVILLDAELNVIRELEPIRGIAPGSSVAMATSGENFLVVVARDTETHRVLDIHRVSSDTTVVTKVAETLEQPLQSPYSPTELAISSHGSGFLLGYSSHARAAVVSLTLDGIPTGPELPLPDVAQVQSGISIVWDGRRHIVATVRGSFDFRVQPQIQLIAIDSSGRFLSSNANSVVRIAGPREPRLVRDARGVVLYYTDGSPREMMAARVFDDLSTADAVPIGRTLGAQSEPDSTIDGEAFVTAWIEGAHLVVGKMSLDGRDLSNGGVVIAAVPAFTLGSRPKVACSDSGCAVGWTRADGTVVLQRLDRSLRITESAIEVAQRGQITDVVAGGGETYLVLFATTEPVNPTFSIPRQHATIVRADRLLQLTRLHETANAANGSTLGTAVWSGNHYLVVWEEPDQPPCYGRFCQYRSRIAGATMHRNGETLGPRMEITASGSAPMAERVNNVVLVAHKTPLDNRVGASAIAFDGSKIAVMPDIAGYEARLTASASAWHLAVESAFGLRFMDVSFEGDALRVTAAELMAPIARRGSFAVASSAGGRKLLVVPKGVALLPHAHSGLTTRLFAYFTHSARLRPGRVTTARP